VQQASTRHVKGARHFLCSGRLGGIPKDGMQHAPIGKALMGFLSFLILGIIAGIIARLIIPGRQKGGWLLTIILGIVGAMLGGWIAGFFVADAYSAFFSLAAWIAAIVGALIVTLIFNALFNRRSRV
jgi:uncharacterized membrane protein YeaQ/YmgE (transglycosylase-associated protein family)